MCSMPSWPQGPADLGGLVPIDRPAGGRGVEVVAAAIGIERAKQPVSGDYLRVSPGSCSGRLPPRPERPSTARSSHRPWSRSGRTADRSRAARHGASHPDAAAFPAAAGAAASCDAPPARRHGKQSAPLQEGLRPRVAAGKFVVRTRCSWKCLAVNSWQRSQ